MQNKYDNVCLANILLHHSQLTDTEKEQQNMMRILSVWGHLAMKIFSTNTLDDRRFLSKLMNIGVPVSLLISILKMMMCESISEYVGIK